MPHKSNFAGAQAKLLPNQPHQSITVRAAASIAMAAGGENKSDLLRRSGFGRNRARAT